jgi:hypothetical protein
VSIDNTNSDLFDLLLGTVQGSVLGPILYAIFVSPIVDIVPLLTFADDSYIIVTNKNKEDLKSEDLNVVQGRNDKNSIPLAEAKMDSEILAARIRKQFAAKKGGAMTLGSSTWQTAPLLEQERGWRFSKPWPSA